MRETWGCVAARVFTDPITYFLTFWVPLYLQQERGFSLAQLGALGWVPFAVYALGNVASGAVPRALIARGVPLDRARKGFMLTVVITNALALLALSRAEGPAMALACLSLVFFGHAAWGAIILPAEVFPARAIGTVSGLGGGLGAAAGVVCSRSSAASPARAPGRRSSSAAPSPTAPPRPLVVLLVRDLGRLREV